MDSDLILKKVQELLIICNLSIKKVNKTHFRYLLRSLLKIECRGEKNKETNNLFINQMFNKKYHNVQISIRILVQIQINYFQQNKQELNISYIISQSQKPKKYLWAKEEALHKQIPSQINAFLRQTEKIYSKQTYEAQIINH
ncbi:unnamed protein product [Paramecium sonneborni]|uniref:Uncharacterized protein n=1 Tax=Paramecium sonneborni TaxID=65129 RepID=A0A8S1JU33_9CILI|nr:unnamed protein product [Paramecium sonneborni]